MILPYPSKLFSKTQKYFPKMFFIWFSKNQLWGIFICVKLSWFPKACFTTFLHMYEPRVVDLISATPLSVHMFIVLGKSFPFHFKMHDITPHWVEPRLSVEGNSWMRSLVSYFWILGWIEVAEKYPLHPLYPTTSMKGRIRWSRSPLRIRPTYQLSRVSYNWPRLSQNPWGLGRAKAKWPSKPTVEYLS